MIRKLLITIFCAMASFAAMAQEERPFEPLFVEGRSWVYQYDNFIHPERNRVYTYTVCGDTIVAGKECKRLVMHTGRENQQDYCFPVYEEGGKSFVIPVEWGSFCPIFDFTVTPGDVVVRNYPWDIEEGYAYAKWTVKDIEEIEVRSHKRRKIILNDCDYPSFETYWLEGIGASHWCDALTIRGYIIDGGSEYFLECRQDGEVILTREDIIELSDVEVVQPEGIQAEGLIYDIYGRRVENPQSRHIYIRNGQKFVQR